MELKHTSFSCALYSFSAFNRTFMELKRVEEMAKYAKKYSFNRTFMELKRIHYDEQGDPDGVF